MSLFGDDTVVSLCPCLGARASWYSDQMPTWRLHERPGVPTWLLKARQAFRDALLVQKTADDHLAQYQLPPG